MIFYFSCTGNTKWAASVLSVKTGERLVDVASVMKNCKENEMRRLDFELEKGERIGFCFPVHGWRPPRLFEKFVEKLNITNSYGHYCYALCTAGDTAGEATDILKKKLRTAGLSINSEFSLIMPESYVGLPFMDVDTPENELKKKAEAAEKLERISDIIIRCKKGVEDVTRGRWPKTNSRLIGELFTRFLIKDSPFHVAADKCVGCGLCVEACPTDNLFLDGDNRPAWKNNGSCLCCFACYHHCPCHAIEYGGRTKRKGQYYFK